MYSAPVSHDFPVNSPPAGSPFPGVFITGKFSFPDIQQLEVFITVFITRTTSGHREAFHQFLRNNLLKIDCGFPTTYGLVFPV
jgi:hypothetical protein